MTKNEAVKKEGSEEEEFVTVPKSELRKMLEEIQEIRKLIKS